MIRRPFRASRNPLVTVVVPVHDTVDYLPEALASIDAQTTPTQVVVVDDGSTDASGDLARRWAEQRPDALVITQDNAGPGAGAARNVGLDHAEGRYVLFLDSDDRLSSGGLDRLVEALEQTHDDLAIGVVTAFPQARSWPWDGVFGSGSETRSVPLEEVPALIHNPAPGNKLFRRKALRRRGLRFAEGIHHQDTYVSIPLLVGARRVTVVPSPVLEYRVRPGSVMSSHFDRQENFFDHLQVVEHLSRLRPDLTPARRHILDTFLVRSMQGFVLRGPQLPPERAHEFLHRAHEVYRQVDPQVLVDVTRSPAHRRAYAAVLAVDPAAWALAAEPAPEIWAHDGALYAGRPDPEDACPLQRLGAVVATVDAATARDNRLELSGRVAVRGAATVHLLPSVTAGLRLKGAAMTVPATTHPESAEMSTETIPPAQPHTRWVAIVDPTVLAAESAAPRLVLETITGQVSTRLRWDSERSTLTVPLGSVTITLQDTDSGPVLVSRPGVPS